MEVKWVNQGLNRENNISNCNIYNHIRKIYAELILKWKTESESDKWAINNKLILFFRTLHSWVFQEQYLDQKTYFGK